MKISVVITTYNREVMVREAVEAVLRQEKTPYEVIVIDDGSTDGTCEGLYDYQDKIIYIRTENHGISHARNCGIIHSHGDYIAFCDADDIWLPTKLAEQATALALHPNFHIVYTDEIWLFQNKRINQKLRHRKQTGWIFEASLPLCLVSPSSVMMHRKIIDTIGWFDELLDVCEDYDFWLRTAHKYPFLFIDKPLIVKRGGHEDQLSRKHWGMDRFRVTALLKLLAMPDLSLTEETQVLRTLAGKAAVLARGYAVRDKQEECRYFLALRQAARKKLRIIGDMNFKITTRTVRETPHDILNQAKKETSQ